MRATKYFLLAAVAVLAGLGAYRAADGDVKDIETIMEKAHTPKESSLFKKVITGKADKDEKKELLALYTDLGKNKPPKGTEADWKKRTDAIVAAAKAVVDDKPDATRTLLRAANCKGCHENHKAD